MRNLILGILLAAMTVATTSACSGPTDDSPRVDVRGTADGAIAVDPAGRTIAEFTDGARTVTVRGPQRTFRDDLLPAVAVATDTWVRLLPHPWTRANADARWFRDWFAAAQDWKSPDVIAVAFEYVDGAPDGYDARGVRYRGDARFGPLAADGVNREEGSDFHDYLNLPWTFPDGTHRGVPRRERGAVDCSGFLRLIFGYRLGMSLELAPDDRSALPRIADDIGHKGPGILIASTHHDAVVALASRMRPGDLVFFDTDSSPDWNHSGIYLGRDTAGGDRFISSRATANGPTIADLAGPSLLSGDGRYARGFVGVRRL